MLNFIQQGNVITAIAPSGGVLSGQGLIYGSFFGVCAIDAVAGAETELAVTGVFSLPKVSPLVINAGDKVYWDDTAKLITKTASGNSLVGAATEAAASTAPTVRVRLNGTTV
jgi:predicted RecA/RadA family phage recombinase